MTELHGGQDSVRRREPSCTLLAGSSVVGAVLALTILSSAAQAESQQVKTVTFGASYFRDLLDKEGPAGVVSRLYVAPPDLRTPLFTGIATGSAEWIDVYHRFRRGVDSADRSGVTKDRLDDSLALALDGAADRILLYLHQHPEIPPGAICGRSAASTENPAEVLDAHELLAIIRRELSVSKVTSSSIRAERSECLVSMSALIRRQTRIYLASFGATDSKSASFASLSDAEKRELNLLLEAARKDRSMSAREDGKFPDGPFRLAKVPRDVLRRCADAEGRIANPEGPWEAFDLVSDPRLPRARLLNACRVTSDEWDLTCERGGFGSHLRYIRVRKSRGRWRLVQEKDLLRATTRDPWLECRSLSKSAPSNQALPPDDHLGRAAPSDGRR